MTIRKMLLGTAAAVALVMNGPAMADQTDLMLVVIESDSGHRTVHDQAASHNSCSVFLEELRKAPVVLTLRNPNAKGRVVEARCILPDGSMLNWPVNAGE
jgi:hypothetical protein